MKESLLKKFDKKQDGTLSRTESENSFQVFIDNLDTNKDVDVSRDEWIEPI